MLSLAAAVACTLAIGMIFKLSGRRGWDRLTLLTINYVVAFVAALGLVWSGGELDGMREAMQSRVLWLGIVQGALFIFGFFVFALATETAGMSLATGVMRVSVAIPFLASWLIWSETPTAFQLAGLALAAAAFFMISRRGSVDSNAAACADDTPDRSTATRTLGVLALLFLSGGATDVGMKTFDEVFADDYGQRLFLTIVFGVAAVLGAGVIAARSRGNRARVTPGVVAWGILLGAANFGSAEFLLQAIRQLSGTVVFPVNNISLVVGAALLGVWFWGERLSTLNWAGLGLAGAALLLLTL